MSDTESIFNNSGVVSPLLEGQGDESGTENVEPEVIESPPKDGQGDVNVEVPQQPSESEPEWSKEYKTPEEMYAALQTVNKSYNSLRPEFTKVTQELSAIRKGSTDNQQSTQYTDPSYKGPQQSPEEVLLGKIQEIVSPIREQNEELIMQNEVVKMASKYPDFTALSGDIRDLFRADEALWSVQNPLEVAYKLAKASKVSSEIGQVVTKAKEDAYADKEIKVLNSTGSKMQTLPQETPKTQEEIIRESILNASSKGGSIF